MEKITLEILAERFENLAVTNAKEHKLIIEQTTKTNGSVSTLMRWRAYITGAIAILVPIFAWLINMHIK